MGFLVIIRVLRALKDLLFFFFWRLIKMLESSKYGLIQMFSSD